MYSDKPLRKWRRSLRRETSVDRISALPDSILVHVLSLLSMEDAVKTQVLSKRWQHLWTYITSLVFRCSSSYTDERVRDFVAFVDKTLFPCNCSKLKNLGVTFPYKKGYASTVNLWTRFAAGKATEEFYLKLDHGPEYFDEHCFYELPQHLYTNSSFTELNFSLCSVMPKGVVCWTSLKELSIGYAKVSEDTIQKILEGSPCLEILELYYFYGLNRLHVSGASLKTLILREVWECEDFLDEAVEEDPIEFEISAPNLQSLQIFGSFGHRICRLGDVSSLFDAILSFHLDDSKFEDLDVYPNRLRGLLQSLVHVKIINFCTWATQVLSIMETKGLHSPLWKCEFIILCTAACKSLLPGIAHMLESSTNLKILALVGSSSRLYEDRKLKLSSLNELTKLCCFDEKCYWTANEKSFKCLISCLHEVMLDGLNWYEFQFYLPFVQYLLKNAMVLQKMVISDCCTDSEKEFVQAVQKLLRFPRSSPDAVVLFYK